MLPRVVYSQLEEKEGRKGRKEEKQGGEVEGGGRR
jgi:hypothetical protein